MGWERKRGKLHELNRLLRGATDTDVRAGARRAARMPPRRALRHHARRRHPAAARRGAAPGRRWAHPLNRPRFSDNAAARGGRLRHPAAARHAVAARAGAKARSTSGCSPRRAASTRTPPPASDVYQDLFGEGSFTGKGIYDVRCVRGRAGAAACPTNTLLSHDLFEGSSPRAGLASDIEVIEEFPSRYDVAATRAAPLDARRLAAAALDLRRARRRAARCAAIGRWKMVDNLRRSLSAPLLLALAARWRGRCRRPPRWRAVLLLLAAIAIRRRSCRCCSRLVPRASARRPGAPPARGWPATCGCAASQTLLLAGLPGATRPGACWTRSAARCSAWPSAAATCWSGPPPRSRRAPRGWTRAASVGRWRPASRSRWPPPSLALLVGRASWPLALPFALLWLGRARRSRCGSAARRRPRERWRCRAEDQDDSAADRPRTWRFFETFVTAADNHAAAGQLPGGPARRSWRTAPRPPTSACTCCRPWPRATSAGSARWRLLERLEADPRHAADACSAFAATSTTGTTRSTCSRSRPPTCRRWTAATSPGTCLVLANACEEWIAAPQAGQARRGVLDHLRLARDAMAQLPAASGEEGRQLALILDEIDAGMRRAATRRCRPRSCGWPTRRRRPRASCCPLAQAADQSDVMFWLEGARRALYEHGRDRAQLADAPLALGARLKLLAHEAREMALAMDFAFLLRPRAQAAVHRLLAGGQPARRELLRPARVRGAAGQPVRHRQGRRDDAALVPPGPRGDAAGRRLGAASPGPARCSST